MPSLDNYSTSLIPTVHLIIFHLIILEVFYYLMIVGLPFSVLFIFSFKFSSYLIHLAVPFFVFHLKSFSCLQTIANLFKLLSLIAFCSDADNLQFNK